MLFRSHHGIHKEEQLTANSFEVNVDVMYDEKKKKFDNINDTIDYVSLYGIVKQQMQILTPLMEKICREIIGKIKKKYPFISEVNISIRKLQVPVENFQGKVGVTMNKKFN